MTCGPFTPNDENRPARSEVRLCAEARSRDCVEIAINVSLHDPSGKLRNKVLELSGIESSIEYECC
jgi:hypothetical protein